MLARLLALTTLLFAMPAGAETLWRGDFSNNWIADWSVTSFGKIDVPVEILEDVEHGAFLRVFFPEGALKEGYTFRTDLSRYIGGREEIYLSYHVRFGPGFEWQRGGKLPGLMTKVEGPITGCNPVDGTDGFSTRFTWGREGKLKVSPYVPPQPGVEPSERGCAAHFAFDERAERGRWIHLVQMVRLNSPGRADGAIRAWMDGEPMVGLDGIRFREVPFGIEGILFATFYGGSCCAPDDRTHIDFADFSLHDTNPLAGEG